jgi:ribose transport system substrate-binding protein
MPITIRRTPRGTLLLGLSVTLVAAACGASSTGTSGGSNSGAAATAAAKAQALLATESQSVSFPSTITPFDASKARGKTVWFISNLASNSFTTLLYNPMVEALNLFGVTVHEFDGKGSAATESQGIEEAIGAHPDAIFIQDIEISSIQAAINDAHKANIPVLEWATVDAGVGPSPGDAASTTYCYHCAGKYIADGVIALGKGNVNAVIITSSDVPVSMAETNAIESEFSAICPSTCHYTTQDVLIADWSTRLPVMGRTISANPSVNWIIPMFDPETTFLDPGVTQAGAASRVSVASYNATSGAVQQLQEAGNPLAVDVGSSLAWSGYACADMTLRVLAGVTPLADSAETIPLRTFTRSNAASIDFSKPDSTWYGSTDFKADYRKAWGLSS